MYRVEGGKDSIRVKVERVDSELYHIYIHTTPLCHSFSMGAAQREYRLRHTNTCRSTCIEQAAHDRPDAIGTGKRHTIQPNMRASCSSRQARND